MISFYPGPSKVYDSIPEYVADAYSSGIVSINHRSDEFMSLMAETTSILKKKLDIPTDYEVFIISSATECWQIIAQAYEGYSYHFYNGSFGEKWFHRTQKLKSTTIGYRFDLNKELRLGELDISMESGVICITQNETSNGSAISNKRITKIRNKYPDHIVAVDATSSMGGTYLQFDKADIWYASVQKCFGLPAGMAVMICSSKAVEKALNENRFDHYNSLANIIINGRKQQTTHTPNVLGIYLLMRSLNDRQSISKIDNQLNSRADEYLKLIMSRTKLSPLVEDKKIRSNTVLVFKGKAVELELLKSLARESDMILGNGYGEWKQNTLRIANFPALKTKEVNKLLSFLDKNLT